MGKFSVDAPGQRVIKALEILGFTVLRERAYFNGSIKPGWNENPSHHAKPPQHKGFHLTSNLYPSRNIEK
jgi:hypothetical protein